MSVEQTTQLIQLILNSVLMIVACAFVLGGLLLRRSALENRLQTTSLEYYQVLHLAYESQSGRLLRLKKQLRHLQQQIQSSRNGITAVYYALMFFVGSTFALSMRTAIDALWLISIAMTLFIAGVGVLLLSVAIILLGLHQSDREALLEHRPWQETLAFPKSGVTRSQKESQVRRVRSARPTALVKPRRAS